MEFLAFEDGKICDERYRSADGVEEPLLKVKKVYLKQVEFSDVALRGDLSSVVQERVRSFTHSPKEVIFKDFTVGDVYTTVVTLTNCTNRSASFRVLPISPKYRDALRVTYIPPPKLSAGLSWTTNIVFTPVDNVDLETSIGFKTEQGIFFVPVKVFKKRPLLSFIPEVINFGIVVCGAKSKKVLTLKNDGALPAKVAISGSLRKLTEVFQKDPSGGEDVPVISMKPVAHQLLVNPFSSCYLDITFSPNEKITIDHDVELRYMYDDIVRVQKIQVKGLAGALPVYISSSNEIDFKWCFYEKTYCEKITITNTTNVSVSVVPEIPTYALSSIAFSPETVRVQANSTFDVYLIFTPRRGLETVFTCDVKWCVTGQISPIMVGLHARLTESGFSVEPTKLDFGVSAPEHQRTITLIVRNLSDLPQTLGFLELPSNVEILPFQTVTMVPKETLNLKVGVRPPTLGQFTQLIKLTNEHCDSQTLQLTGCGYRYPWRFMSPCLTLPPCPYNTEVSCTTVLANCGSHNQRFHLSSCFEGLRVSPSSGVIPAGESIPIVVIFTAPGVHKEPVRPTEQTQRPTLRGSKKGKEKEVIAIPEKPADDEQTALEKLYSSWENSLADEPWSRHKAFFVTCGENNDKEVHSVFLQVNCTVIKPTLIARCFSRVLPKIITKEVSKRTGRKKNAPPFGGGVGGEVVSAATVFPVVQASEGGTRIEVMFGEVPLKSTVEKICVLSYTGEDGISLQMRPVDTLSPFQVVKPPPAFLVPGEECAMVIKFNPDDYGSYKNYIVISASGANDVKLFLTGVCRPADIIVNLDRDTVDGQPHSIESLILDTIQLGQITRKQLYLRNRSSLPIEVNAEFLTDKGEVPEWPENRTFFLESDSLTVPGNSKGSMTVVFCPQVAETLRLKLHICAGAFNHCIAVEGRGCELPVFFTFSDPDPVDENDQILSIPVQPSTEFPHPGLSPLYPIQLHFFAEEVQTISIGCVKLGANVECTVNGWSENYVQNGWKLEPMKVNVSAGAHATFTLTYTPNRDCGDVSFCAFNFTTKSSLPQAETICYVRCAGTM